MALSIFQRTVTDNRGNIIPGASVAVRDMDGGDLVPIFEDRAGAAPMPNPFVTDSEGMARFYTEPGEYQVTATSDLGSVTWVHVAIDGTVRSDLSDPAQGAEMVAFKQAGTGAVDRTASDKLSEIVSVKDFGAVGDGVTDDTAAVQAALNCGAKVIKGVPGENYSVLSVTMSDGQTLDLNGASITAGGAVSILVDIGNNCAVINGTIDSANTQGSGTVNTDGANIGVRATGKSNTSIRNVTFKRYRQGVSITSNVAGVYSRNHLIHGCSFEAYVWSSTTPDTNQLGAYIGATVTPVNSVIGTFGPQWAEALLVSGIRVEGCNFYGGQYGLAMHRASNFTITGNHFEEASRAISVQHQSRDFAVSANTFAKQHSTDIHMATGPRNGVVVGNVCTGVKANDNVCIQAYYGCEDIEIVGNVLDSQFDQWDGGPTLDTRSPRFGIRVGQMSQRIRIARNKIRGFLEGIGVYTTIYSTILPSDPNYQNSGAQRIDIEDNDVVFDYEQLTASGYKSQLLQNDSFGCRVRKHIGAESAAAGAWGLDGIRLSGNKFYETRYPIEWAYVADTSGSPVAKTNLRSRRNVASSSVGTNNEAFSGSMDATDVDSRENTWADSNFQGWTSFTPTFSGLTVVLGGGSVSYSGKYRKVGNTLDFVIYVVPSGGATTASTAGSTAASISGFKPSDGGICYAANATNGQSIGVGVTNTNNNSFVVTPTWAATTASITIAGQVRL